MNQIVERILKAHVIVADLTGNNGSVGYELGYAHAKAKPTILLVQLGYAVPYDLRDMRRITYDYSDRRAMKRSFPELVDQLKLWRSRPPVCPDNPLLNATRIYNAKTQPPTSLPPKSLLQPPSLSTPSPVDQPTSGNILSIVAKPGSSATGVFGLPPGSTNLFNLMDDYLRDPNKPK